MNKTFWEGHRAQDLEVLQKHIPIQGKCPKDRPMLEEWRKFQNAYYRLHNDGDRANGKLRFMAKRFDVEPFWSSRHIEELGNRVLDAALKELENENA